MTEHSFPSILTPHLHDDIIFSILRGHMNEGVPSHVESVRPGPPQQEKLHNVPVPMDTCIVKGGETVLVPKQRNKATPSFGHFECTNLTQNEVIPLIRPARE